MGTDRVFAADLQALRPHPGQADSAANLRALLAHSPIMESHRDDCEIIQDAYSLRCAPQVAGAVRDTIARPRLDRGRACDHDTRPGVPEVARLGTSDADATIGRLLAVEEARVVVHRVTLHPDESPGSRGSASAHLDVPASAASDLPLDHHAGGSCRQPIRRAAAHPAG